MNRFIARLHQSTAAVARPVDPRALDKPLRRELILGDKAYTLTIDPEGLKIVEKGRRNGITLRWSDLVNGDAAIAAALQASLNTNRT